MLKSNLKKSNCGWKTQAASYSSINKMSFSGFSEDDIRKITNTNSAGDADKVGQVTFVTTKKGILKKSQPKNRKENALQQVIVNGQVNASDDTIPESALLSKVDNVISEDVALQISVDDKNGADENEKCDVQKSEQRLLDLDGFQARQKYMEEQNRKRKELLAKALADRTKQTQEEVEKLSLIRNELKNMDAVLSNDVKILRSQIETASLEYTEAQKRYNKTEKEFLDAKLHLHQKLERKELLTEHLCAIIEKNEERKAEKLTSLLQKLNISATNCILANDELKQNTQISDISSSNDL